jgi:hypothetical protein
MPVLWNVFHATRLVVISMTGDVHLKEMEECVEGIMTPATLSYRKLVDLMDGQPTLSRQDIAALVDYARGHGGASPPGALAIAVGSDESEHQARLFGSLSEAERPWQIFRDPASARTWLDSQPSRAHPPWPDDERTDGADGALV